MMDSENMVMHSDSITNIFDISCEVLEQYLKTKSNVMLVIDCRPFLAHNESHIVNAINVHCPPILRRRTGGRLPLKTIITDIVVRERLIAGQFFPVILYEDSILNSSESTCGFVARCLQQETSLEFIYILKGGFQQFAHRYPNSCTRNGHLISPGYSNLIKSPSAGHLTWLTVKNGTTVGSFYKGNHSPRTPKALNTIYGPLYMDNSIHLVTRESDQGEPVEILPYLYLGSGYHASCKRNLEKLGITALLNVSQNCPNYFEDTFTYKCIPVEDSSSEEISLWFDEAIDFIDSIKQSNGKVLVHCRAGISRSATICMAYLMATKKLRMEESYEFVKSRRRIVSPNFNFMGQLLGFEAKLFNSPTVNGLRSSNKKCIEPPRSPLIAFPANNLNGSHCSFNNCLSSSSSSSSSSPSSSSSGHPPSHLSHFHNNNNINSNNNNIINMNNNVVTDNPPATPSTDSRTPDSSSSPISASSCLSSSLSSSKVSSSSSSSSSIPGIASIDSSSSVSSSSASSASSSSSSFSSFSSSSLDIIQQQASSHQDRLHQKSRSIFEFNQVPTNYLPAPTDLSSSLFEPNKSSGSESTYEPLMSLNKSNNNNSSKLMTPT